MKNTLTLIFILAIGFISCEKTVDSETNRWNSNQASLKRLMSEYPNFKAALETQLAEATQIFKVAADLPNEEARIEMMAKANNTARPTYVKQLDGMDKKIEQLRESIVELIDGGGEKELLIAGVKFNNAESVIYEAKSYLSSVTATDKYQAEQVVKKAVGKIDRMTKSIEDRLRTRKRQLKEQEKDLTL